MSEEANTEITTVEELVVKAAPRPTYFMCKIAYDHELGWDSGGTKLYPSMEALKQAHPMWEECGIVEVAVDFIQVVVEENEEMMLKNAKPLN